MSTIAHYNAQGQEIASAYAATTDKAERKRQLAAAIALLQPKIGEHVRRSIPSQYADEAEQAGRLGVIVALHRYAGSGTSQTFDRYAFSLARNEIQAWADRAIYWRKEANRGKSEARVKAREAIEANGGRTFSSLDAPIGMEDEKVEEAPGFQTSILKVLPLAAPSPEEQLADCQELELLKSFLASLSSEDQELLLTEDHRRRRSRHCLDLIGRARAFMGADDDGPGSVVSGDQGSGRPDGQPAV